MNKKNGGYSVVEIVIVIAIMAVLTGGLFFSVNMVFGANAKTCANDLRAAIAQNKVNAMGKSESKVIIERDASNNCIYATQVIGTFNRSTGMLEWNNEGPSPTAKREKISNARVYVEFIAKDGTNDVLDPGESVEICFDRSTGSFKANDAGIIYSEILVEGGRRSFTVVLTELTGKVSVEVN